MSRLGRLSERARLVASIVLTVVASTLLLAGGIALYAREEIVDADSFADKSQQALEEDEIRTALGTLIVANVVDRGSTNLISARPLIESVVDALLETKPFQKGFRAAVRDAHKVLFAREGSDVVLDLDDADKLVKSTLSSVDPKLAKRIPDLDPTLVKLQERDFATQTLRVADDVRDLGIVLPILALLAFAAAIVVAPDRRAAVTRAGIGVAAAAAISLIAHQVALSAVLSNVHGTEELEDDQARAAVREAWHVYLDGLNRWSLIVGGLGLVIAAASATLLQPIEVTERAERAARIFTMRPPSTAWRLARAGGALLLGLLVLLNPELAIKVVAVIAGALIFFFGVSEALAVVARPGAGKKQKREEARRTALWAGGAAVGAVLLVVVLAIVLTGGGGGEKAPSGPVKACNGSPELCDKPLNEVVFAGTHNSMSAADDKGWFFANQRRDIPTQLKDGIRLFLIDPHHGVVDKNGKIRTDLEADGTDRNRVGKALGAGAIPAAERLAGRVGAGNLDGKREPYLCHSICELGSTKMLETLTDIREFLEQNRGEVVIFLLEPSVAPKVIDKTFRESGLIDYVHPLERDDPMPTLREMVDSNKRVVVFSESPDVGDYPWHMYGFDFIQDTPLGVTNAEDFSCALERGEKTSPFFMLNNWLDGFPPPLRANARAGKRAFLEKRIRRCAKQRGVDPTLIAVDYYDQGDLVEIVNELNGVKKQDD